MFFLFFFIKSYLPTISIQLYLQLHKLIQYFMKKTKLPYHKKTTVRSILLLVFHGFVQIRANRVSSSSKGEISAPL